MANYITIVEAKQALKGSIIARAVLVGKSETGNKKSGGSFTKQEVTLRDKSGDQIMILWDGDVNKFQVDQYYKIENPYWTTYKDNIQLGLGKYYKIELATEADLLPFDQSKIPQPSTPPQTTAAPEPSKPTVNDSEFLALAEKQMEKTLPLVKQSIQEIWAIEQIVKHALRLREGQEPDKQRVGMYVKLVRDSAGKTN